MQTSLKTGPSFKGLISISDFKSTDNDEFKVVSEKFRTTKLQDQLIKRVSNSM